jgi:transposase
MFHSPAPGPLVVSETTASPPAVVLTAEGRQLIERWIQAGATPQRVVKRARIVLLAGEGWSVRAIARTLCVSAHTVRLWRRRFLAGGPESLLHDAPGRGRTATVSGGDSADRILRLVETTLAAGDRWTIRRLASVTGVSRASIHRILRAARS